MTKTAGAVIATGVDGTTLPLVGEAYKEAMCGTIALYDKAGQRLTTEYLGTLPEAGKATCTHCRKYPPVRLSSTNAPCRRKTNTAVTVTNSMDMETSPSTSASRAR